LLIRIMLIFFEFERYPSFIFKDNYK
jgi:hypothetical protein